MKEQDKRKSVCLQCYKMYCEARSNAKEYCPEFNELKKKGKYQL